MWPNSFMAQSLAHSANDGAHLAYYGGPDATEAAEKEESFLLTTP